MAELKTEAQQPIRVLPYNPSSDRGWNDPPTLAFSNGGTSAPRRRIDLRKRVAHDCVNTTLTQGVSGLQLGSQLPAQPNGFMPPYGHTNTNGHYPYQNGFTQPPGMPHHPQYHHSTSMPNLQHPTQEESNMHAAVSAGMSNYWSTPPSGVGSPVAQHRNISPTLQFPGKGSAPTENLKNPIFSMTSVLPGAVPVALSSPERPIGNSSTVAGACDAVQQNGVNVSKAEVIPAVGAPVAIPQGLPSNPMPREQPQLTHDSSPRPEPSHQIPGAQPTTPPVAIQTSPAVTMQTSPPPKGLPPPARGYSPTTRTSRYPVGQTIPTVPVVAPSFPPVPPPMMPEVSNTHLGHDEAALAYHHSRSSSMPNLPEFSGPSPSPAAQVGPPPTGGYYAGRASSARTSRDRTPSPPKLEPAVTTQEDTNVNDTEIMDLTTKKLYTCVNCCTGQVQQKALEEIYKRIEMFEQRWKARTMSISVRTRMAELALALENSKYDDADRIHKSLIVDYPGEVSSWMVGIKKLITLMRDLPSR